MDVRITARRVDISDSFRLRADERARKLVRYQPRLLSVEVVVEEDGAVHAVELRASVAGTPPMIARAEADSERSALDRAMDRMRRQLRRDRSRRTEHQAPPRGALAGE
jgi:ribosomal subunit interface protein